MNTQVDATDPGGLAAQLRISPKSWYDLRPAAVALTYLALLAALEWTSVFLQSPLAGSWHSGWHFPAGLSLALLVGFGLHYAPVLLAASLLTTFWINPLPASVPVTLSWVLVAATLQFLGAAVIRNRTRSAHWSLGGRADAARFLLTVAVLSPALSANTAVWRLLSRDLAWDGLAKALSTGSIGYAFGILALTPFLLLHGVPRFESLLQKTKPGKSLSFPDQGGLKRTKPALLNGALYLALIACTLWLVFKTGVGSDFAIFCLFSLPLVLAALKYGFGGVSLVILAQCCAVVVVLSRLAAGGDEAVRFQALLLASTLNGLLMGAGITELRCSDRLMKRRDAILDAVSYAAEQFLGKNDWESGVYEVLKKLGEAAGVSRVFILDNRFTASALSVDALPHEWAAPAASTDENDLKVLGLLRSQFIQEQAQSLTKGEAFVCRTRDIAPKKREILEALGIRSLVIVPMFIDQQWWGSIGLEQCFEERDWSEADVDTFRMAAHILGTLLASIRVEQQFRQLTGNIQAVFWISSPDGEKKIYASPAYAEIWGRSNSSLYESPASWLNAIAVEDQLRIKAALVKQVWGEFDEEYRVVRPDKSVRWVRDRAFPVRDQSGQVYRIVGIAEDITKQKKVEEKLRATTVLLSSLIDGLQSGIVVEDEVRRITHVNQAFSNMFDIPVQTESLFGVDSRLLFVKPRSFGERIEQIIKAGVPVMNEELVLHDRTFRRDYIPLSIGEDYRYHLWQYQDVTDSKLAEQQIKSSLQEKEVLLKEIHHRVKNNLQIISSLLNLQATQIEDKHALQTFKESQDRVKAMALIHERLYQSRDLAKIDFAGYVRNLTSHLLRSYKVKSNVIRLKLEVDSVPMNFDVAIPCGLIIHELVSNSLKYAFPYDTGGEILIRFMPEGERHLRLTVKDNGAGIAQDIDLENTQSLGLKLVRSLVEQLNGSIAYRNENGFECDIRISRHKS